MPMGTEAISNPQPERKINRWSRLHARIKSMLPFTAGIVAALAGLYLYNAINPPPQPLTETQLNQVVAQAMASATPEPAYSAQVYQIIQPSLVLIQAKGHDANGDEAGSLGSGVIISDQGAILTALHVVDGAESVEVVFADGTRTGALVALTQPENDIAVLQPVELPAVLIPAVMGNPNAMRVGDEAYAVGNPFGLYSSISAGVISGFDRTFQVEDSETHIEGLIQIDSAVNPGNSGGPLLNRAGQVVGIVIGILNPTEDDFFVGIGFAVPITTAGGAAGAPLY